MLDRKVFDYLGGDDCLRARAIGTTGGRLTTDGLSPRWIFLRDGDAPRKSAFERTVEWRARAVEGFGREARVLARSSVLVKAYGEFLKRLKRGH